MKRVLNIMAFLALFITMSIFSVAGCANAEDITLRWDASLNANGYVVYMSVDSGAAWDSGRDTGALVPDAQGEVEFIYANAPDTGLTLFRITAYNSQGESSIPHFGPWNWQDMPRPPMMPSGVGVHYTEGEE